MGIRLQIQRIQKMKRVIALTTVLVLATLAMMCGEAASAQTRSSCPSCCTPQPIVVTGQVNVEGGQLERGAIGVQVLTLAYDGSSIIRTRPRLSPTGSFRGVSFTCSYTLVIVHLTSRGEGMYPNNYLFVDPEQVFGDFQESFHQEFNAQLVPFKQ